MTQDEERQALKELESKLHEAYGNKYRTDISYRRPYVLRVQSMLSYSRVVVGIVRDQYRGMLGENFGEVSNASLVAHNVDSYFRQRFALRSAN